MCVCVCLYVYISLWHVSIRIFNMFMTALRKIRFTAFVTDNNNQLALKCLKNLPYGLRPWRSWQACWQCILCQTNRRTSQNQSKTDIYVFSVIFHSPPPPTLFLKVHKNSHSMGKWLFFYYRKHPNTSLHLFVIDFTILDRLRTFRIFFERNVILLPFIEIWYFYSYLWNKTECLWIRDFLSYYLPWSI
jgi:hypothetical protein